MIKMCECTFWLFYHGMPRNTRINCAFADFSFKNGDLILRILDLFSVSNTIAYKSSAELILND